MAYNIPGGRAAAEDFYGCCGACLFYFGNSVNAGYVADDLKALADLMKDKKSVALIAINSSQKEYLHKVLIDFGCVEQWGPVVNINTRLNIFGYMLDLAAYRNGTMKKPEVRIDKPKALPEKESISVREIQVVLTRPSRPWG